MSDASGNSSDLLMLMMRRGTAVPGECSAHIHEDDQLLKGCGFVPARRGQPGTFCQLTSFSLGLNLNDGETSGNAISQRGAKGGIPSASAAAGTGAGAADTTQKFAKWRSATTEDEIRYPGYISDMDPIEFERLMDVGSPTLFKSCVDTVTFDSAIIVKRRSIGMNNALQSYLKLTFNKVLIISLDWDNDSGIKEKGKFIYQSMSVVYRRQQASGKLDTTGSANWQQQLQQT